MQQPKYLYLGLLLGLSSAVWAQNSAPPSPPPTSSFPQDASGLSKDKTFPEDEPAPTAPPNDSPKKRVPSNAPSNAPPRSDSVQVDDLGSAPGDSSSKDTQKDSQIDLDAPTDDAKAHPQSSAALADAVGSGGITEFHTWDPHKAAKSVEVGDFYFRRKNYRAAEDRYREALHYKDDDAVATIRLAVCLEKQGISDDARAEYESYLKILPHGPQASEAQKAIDRLKAQAIAAKPAQ